MSPTENQMPDEVMIMPTEEYLAWVAKSFENCEFVAFNVSRTLVMTPDPEKGQANFVGNVVVGFNMDEVHNVPEAMAILTGNDHQIITATDTAIGEMLKARFTPNTMQENGVYIGEMFEKTLDELGQPKITVVPVQHPELEAALASFSADDLKGAMEF